MPRGAVETGDGAAEAGRVGLAPRGENEEERPDEGEDAARSHALPPLVDGCLGLRAGLEEGAGASSHLWVCVWARALLSQLRALFIYRGCAPFGCICSTRRLHGGCFCKKKKNEHWFATQMFYDDLPSSKCLRSSQKKIPNVCPFVLRLRVCLDHFVFCIFVFLERNLQYLNH